MHQWPWAAGSSPLGTTEEKQHARCTDCEMGCSYMPITSTMIPSSSLRAESCSMMQCSGSTPAVRNMQSRCYGAQHRWSPHVLGYVTHKKCPFFLANNSNADRTCTAAEPNQKKKERKSCGEKRWLEVTRGDTNRPLPYHTIAGMWGMVVWHRTG